MNEETAFLSVNRAWVWLPCVSYPIATLPGFTDVLSGMLKNLSLAPCFSVYLGTHCRSVLLNAVWPCWCYLPPQSPVAVAEVYYPLPYGTLLKSASMWMLIIFFEYSLFLLCIGKNSFAITTSTTFIIPQTSAVTALHLTFLVTWMVWPAWKKEKRE